MNGNLSQAGTGSAPTRKKILSAGHNAALLRLRNTTIEAAGYQVITTKESQVLLQLAEAEDFDAVVLCSSIPVHLQEVMVREIKQRKPGLPVVIICAKPDQERFQKLADATVPAEFGISQPLIEAITSCAGVEE
jgi:DNA-binding NtrC family response regulator